MKHNDHQHQHQTTTRRSHIRHPASWLPTTAWSTRSTMQLSLLCFYLFFVSTSETYAECTPYKTLIRCTNTMVSDEEIAKHTGANDLYVKDFTGELTTNGNLESEISSIQFQDSTISYIQPRYFYRFTNGNLKILSLTRVSGLFRLNSETLGGLESVLLRLAINDHQLQDMGDISNLQELEVLKLVRTGLQKLPIGFEKLVTHLKDLDVSGNKLTALPWSALAKRLEDSYFRGLRVGNNPWHCDCQLKPILLATIGAKRKVTGLQCASPPELAGQTLDTLKVEDVCTAPEEPEVLPVPPLPTKAPPAVDLNPSAGKEPTGDAGGDNSEVSSAGANRLSAEVIVVIVAVCVVVLIIISAVVAYKVRQRNERRRTASTKTTHKSNSYCAVIENPEDGKGAHSGKRSGNVRINHDSTERQPLSGQGYNGNYRDPRL